MRTRFKPGPEQRRASKGNLARLLQPREALDVLSRAGVPEEFTPNEAECRVESVHPDRFVLRVDLRADGHALTYALKVYSDDFAEKIWAHCRSVAAHRDSPDGALCLPVRYVPEERMLVFPWVEGPFLSEITDGRKPDLLRRAARLVAHIHSLTIVPEAETTLGMILDEVSERCERFRCKWPIAFPAVEPFPEMLREAAKSLDSAAPAMVHGDLGAGQFVWSGERLVLLDPDSFGYTDPAYDAGHFLAQQERRCLLDQAVRDHSDEWLGAFSDAYHAAMPQVSTRHVSFYRALTLVRKMYTVCRRDPEKGPIEARALAAGARHHLQVVTGGV